MMGNNEVIVIHKVMKGERMLTVENISNLFVVKNNDNYNLRNNIDYTLEKPKNKLFKKKISSP